MVSLFITHFALCLFMTGLIWIIQLVHYPAFRFIDKNEFTLFSSFHTKNISMIVLPVMLAELITCFMLLRSNLEVFLIINFILVILTFIVTILISMPLHKRLQIAKDTLAIQKLVSTNWLRTLFWSLRSILLIIYAINEIGLSREI